MQRQQSHTAQGTWEKVYKYFPPRSFSFCPLLILLSIFYATACDKTQPSRPTPFVTHTDDTSPHFDLTDIQQNGELIVLTLYGPDTYFEFRGEQFGTQYLLVRHYARHIGASLRIDVSRNPQELFRKLLRGDGDLIACMVDIPDSLAEEIDSVGGHALRTFAENMARTRGDTLTPPRGAWAVRRDAPLLSTSLSQWLNKNRDRFIEYTTIHTATNNKSTRKPRLHAQPALLDATHGRISRYDALFRQYATQCGWDWRLLAAQAYQESSFDSQAVSHMGAMGLMQLMPSTADDVGLSSSDVFVPQHNVRGATTLIRRLQSHYASIADPEERICFVLAAYNAGPGHIDDARTVAKSQGKDPDRWNGHVATIIPHMSKPAYYNLPQVRHGYFRGEETDRYVSDILARHAFYKSKIPNPSPSHP